MASGAYSSLGYTAQGSVLGGWFSTVWVFGQVTCPLLAARHPSLGAGHSKWSGFLHAKPAWRAVSRIPKVSEGALRFICRDSHARPSSSGSPRRRSVLDKWVHRGPAHPLLTCPSLSLGSHQSPGCWSSASLGTRLSGQDTRGRSGKGALYHSFVEATLVSEEGTPCSYCSCHSMISPTGRKTRPYHRQLPRRGKRQSTRRLLIQPPRAPSTMITLLRSHGTGGLPDRHSVSPLPPETNARDPIPPGHLDTLCLV